MATKAPYHATVTLTGSAQALTAVYQGGIRWVSLQPDPANVNPSYVGGSGITSADYGVRLPAPSAGIPPPPHIIGEFADGTVALSDIYVIGTVGEKLHLHVLPYE